MGFLAKSPPLPLLGSSPDQPCGCVTYGHEVLQPTNKIVEQLREERRWIPGKHTQYMNLSADWPWMEIRRNKLPHSRTGFYSPKGYPFL